MKLGLGYLEEVKTMEGEVELEDEICSTIVVYELCARLLLNEDASISNYFSSLASERLNSRLMDKYKTKAKQEKRTDKYSSTLRVGD
jgi:hypothetical protein